MASLGAASPCVLSTAADGVAALWDLQTGTPLVV
jgi:hypothetical protein